MFRKKVLKIALPVTLQSLLQSSFSVIDQVMIGYLGILSVSFLPMAVSSIVTTMLRCMEEAMLPLYASIFALFLNTGLNYLLIFGKWIFPELGVEGAALSSVVSQLLSCVIVVIFFGDCIRKQGEKTELSFAKGNRKTFCFGEYGRQYLSILCPMLVCEFLWGMGENVYTAIYGNIGTDACAAMTMTIPVQTLMIGALSGLSQAAGILVGKSLGKGKYEKAYAESKQMMICGFAGSVLLSAALIMVSPLYVKFYNVGTELKELTKKLLIVYAVVAPVKIQNMILGGGIIRSGGKTKYIMWIDMAGTWIFGVPLGVFAAFFLKLPVTYVYFILSMEECVRLAASLMIFWKRVWMRSL